MQTEISQKQLKKNMEKFIDREVTILPPNKYAGSKGLTKRVDIPSNFTEPAMNQTEDIKEKEAFFAQYWGQLVGVSLSDPYGIELIYNRSINEIDYLLLKDLKDISDAEAIELGRLAHQLPKANFILTRLNDIIHIENISNGITNHVCLNYKYGTINCNVKMPNEMGKIESYKSNIGEIQNSARRPVPYIAIVDYLRSEGFLLPFRNYSIDDIISKGWAKYKTQ